MNDLAQQVLRTDIGGMPLEWIGYQEAARLYHLDQVVYECGSALYDLHGGICALTGRQSILTVHSIIATPGDRKHLRKQGYRYVPPLNNHTLFRRDARLCLYCGGRFQTGELSRDHVTPVAQGGRDHWNNVVTACKRCNNHKADRTPEQSGMQLLAVPFTPTHAEYVYLKGRRVLADQMEFLLAHFPRTSPLHERLSGLLAQA
ncbi:5-methylcytosine-specific restriction endonuclease McrA [Natronospira proteinivora]|uniref:5-methylcytosine-specific restriction endonuclease McrA n=1 Tax=Natronospira proteinivora TaxID=1807133 RepID=A0ABT1GDZ6_9GAMM|nr:HNH endonuclease [Natronospira proteinivora]MCP1728167.1 5-methylcytosine-specific restriction endonuclease McrA [Natronospira proteinivora]